MESNDAAQAFAALGQPTRLELLRALLEAGPSGLAPGGLAARLGLPASTLSFHLRALEGAGLVAATRQGRSLIYAAQLMRLRGVLGFLAGACQAGQPRAGSALRRMIDDAFRERDAMPTPPAFSVLFLCTRNAARSIMAEAILRKVGGSRFAAHSAGSEPAPEGPLPEVLSQLKALGHDVSGLRSKSWQAFTGPDAPRMDFVIALCDTLHGQAGNGQACPEFGDTLVTAAWPLPDPAKFTGSTAERATLLNELHAGLRRRIEIFASLPIASLDRMALKARVEELADPHALTGAR